MSNSMPIASPVRTQAIVNRYFMHAKKNLGQNFLVDLPTIKGIVEAADIQRGDQVIEIGPGIGALTEQLAKAAHQVLALEIDDRLLPVLKETLAPYPNVEVIHQDILKANLKELIAEHFDGQHRLKIVANLPYYITTPIIMHLLATELAFDQIVVMMQKEVANRLAAQPGSKDYGSLSIGVQYEMDCHVAFIVPKTVFVPQPKVDSAIISLTKKKAKEYQPKDERFFHQLVRGAFMHRRKSLWNNLQGLYGKQAEVKEKLSQALAQAEIEPSVRAERLTIADFVRLADCLLATGVKVK